MSFIGWVEGSETQQIIKPLFHANRFVKTEFIVSPLIFIIYPVLNILMKTGILPLNRRVGQTMFQGIVMYIFQ